MMAARPASLCHAPKIRFGSTRSQLQRTCHTCFLFLCALHKTPLRTMTRFRSKFYEVPRLSSTHSSLDPPDLCCSSSHFQSHILRKHQITIQLFNFKIKSNLTVL